MAFKYLITDTVDGRVVGTNDDKHARELAECEEFFVVQVDLEVVLIPNGKSQAIEEI